jgi:hypothetical protein
MAQSSATVLRPSNTSSFELPSLSWEKIKARTKINYFNFATGPSLKKWDDNEVSDEGKKNPEPVSMYQSMNIRYNISGANDFFIVPRVAIPMGDTGQLRPTQDHHSIMADDWDFGLYHTFAKTQTLDYGQSYTYRIPISVKTRDNEQVQRFYVWTHWLNWAISNNWRLLHWTTFTYYDFKQESTLERYRANFRSILNYNFTDKWSSQIGYELDMQHINPADRSSSQYRRANYFKRYHSYITAGVGYSPIHHWTVLPYLRAMDERNIRNETLALGFMIFGRVL